MLGRMAVCMSCAAVTSAAVVRRPPIYCWWSSSWGCCRGLVDFASVCFYSSAIIIVVLQKRATIQVALFRLQNKNWLTGPPYPKFVGVSLFCVAVLSILYSRHGFVYRVRNAFIFLQNQCYWWGILLKWIRSENTWRTSTLRYHASFTFREERMYPPPPDSWSQLDLTGGTVRA